MFKTTPTMDQYVGQLRTLMPVIGTLLAALGIVTPDSWQTISADIINVFGALLVVGGFAWQWIADSRKSITASTVQNLATAGADEKAAIVAAVAKLPEVAAVTLDSTAPEAHAIAAATPSNVQTQ